ncbi:uncharacterized protein cfap92, partial [Callorhinchus milii]|uniref:uncharacterized protein cfap92 n=1 Tax=Callorhinchus milii TaxID=7868 RepID=UPI001C3F9A37
KAQNYYHLEFSLFPDEAEPIKIDLADFGLAVKVYMESETKVLVPWDDGERMWVAWNQEVNLPVTRDLLLKLMTHIVTLQVWDHKEKVSPKARFDRPRGFRVLRQKGGVRPNVDDMMKTLVLSQKMLFKNGQPRASSTLLRNNGKNIGAVVGKISNSEELITVVVTSLDQKIKEIPKESTRSFQKAMSLLQEINPIDSSDPKRLSSGIEQHVSSKTDGPRPMSERKLCPDQESKASSAEEKLKLLVQNEENNSISDLTKWKYTNKKGSIKVTSKDKKREIDLHVEPAAVINLDIKPLVAGSNSVTNKLEKPCQTIMDAYFTLSLKQSLLSDKLQKELNPLVIRILSVTSMPSTPISISDLEDRCNPVTCQYQFMDLPCHQTLGREHGTNVYFNDVNVILTGTVNAARLREYLLGPVLEIEVHDRDRKLRDQLQIPALFGAEPEDSKLSNVGLVSCKRTLHNPFTDTNNSWDPFGVAKVSLTELLDGKRVLNMTIPIQGCRSPDPSGSQRDGLGGRILGVAGAVDGPQDVPLPMGHYLESNAQLKLRVEIAYPLSRYPQEETRDEQTTDIETVNKESVDEETADVGILVNTNVMIVETQSADKELLDIEAVDKEIVDKETVDKTTVDKTTVDKTTVDKTTVDKTTVDKTTVDKETVDKETVDKETVDKETVDKEEFDVLDEMACPFGRIIYIFDFRNQGFLQELVSEIKEVNATGLCLESLPKRASPLRRLNSLQRDSSRLDILTGFHVTDDNIHLFVLEGLRDGGVRRLWERLPARIEAAETGRLDVRYSSDLSFHNRLYMELDPSITTIHLHESLQTITRQPLLYVRDMVPQACFHGIIKLYSLCSVRKLRDAVHNDLFPTAEMVTLVSREFGVPASRAHLKRGGPPKVIPYPSPADTASTCLSHPPCRHPLDSHNKAYVERKREQTLHKNFTEMNMEAVQRASRRLQRKKGEMVTVFPTDGKQVYPYSIQALNSIEQAKALVRAEIAKDPKQHFTYGPEYMSAKVDPVDVEKEWKLEMERSRAAWLTFHGFQYPGFKTSLESNRHPIWLSRNRIEELKTPWNENNLHRNLESPLSRGAWKWHNRKLDFDLYSHPPCPALPVSNHLTGDVAKAEQLEAIQKFYDDWRSKLVVDNTRVRCHRCGVGTEQRTQGPKASNDLDRLKSLRKDKPAKYTFKVHDTLLKRPPSSKLQRQISCTPETQLENRSGFGPGKPEAHSLGRHAIPRHNMEHRKYAELKGHDFNLLWRQKSYVYQPRLKPLTKEELRTHLFTFREVTPSPAVLPAMTREGPCWAQ